MRVKLGTRISRRYCALSGPFTGHNSPWGREQDLDIGPEGTRPDVSEIKTNHLVKGASAAPNDLPQSSDPWFCFEHATPVPVAVLLDFVVERGPRAAEGT